MFMFSFNIVEVLLHIVYLPNQSLMHGNDDFERFEI